MTRTFYARYHGGDVSNMGPGRPAISHEAGDLCEMEFCDEESASAAFAVAGRGTAEVVVDDRGVVHRNVDTLCGFSTSRREMELRSATWRER